MCSLAPSFKSPQKQACCDAQSSLGSCSQWSSPSLLPPGASCMQWSVFLVPKVLSPLKLIVSYVNSNDHSVWTSKTHTSGSESSCTDVQTSMTNSILVSLQLQPKQLQKWSKNKKCLKIGMWQFVSCTNRSLKSVRPGADQSSKAAFGKRAFAKMCFLLSKIRLVHINWAKSKNSLEHVLAESILLVARAKMCS